MELQSAVQRGAASLSYPLFANWGNAGLRPINPQEGFAAHGHYVGWISQSVPSSRSIATEQADWEIHPAVPSAL
jgi:hypothetical protein